MASGSRRRRGDDEYVFIDGRAMRSDEAVRIDLREMMVPGQREAVGAGAVDAAVQTRPSREVPARSARESLRQMGSDDAFALTDEAASGGVSFEAAERLMREDRRIMRTKYLLCGALLVVLAAFSACMSSTQPGTFHTPVQVLVSIGQWIRLGFVQLFQPALYLSTYRQVMAAHPYLSDCMLQVWLVFKFCACGALLALAGMLYQNTFRNPIAAPSMLGVSNGINFALLVLVMQYGYAAVQHTDRYYLYSMIGGIAVLVLVMLGGKWISGKGNFNVVNMILMGTIVSQLLGVVTTYVQAVFMDDAAWDAYYLLQNATGVQGVWPIATLLIGGIVALVPVVLFRFKLNLISFSDDESRLLGAKPNRLRIVALGCGSVMMLVAQLNAGQVAMVSLVIPFIVRAVFGSEFRKQLGGNLLMGALVLLACNTVGTFIMFEGMPVGVGPVVSVVAIPLFVWMLAIRQRSWE